MSDDGNWIADEVDAVGAELADETVDGGIELEGGSVLGVPVPGNLKRLAAGVAVVVLAVVVTGAAVGGAAVAVVAAGAAVGAVKEKPLVAAGVCVLAAG